MTVTDRLLSESDEPSGPTPDFSNYPTEPPVDVPGVLVRLGAIQAIAERQPPRFAEDGLACFNYLYREITTEVWEQIQLGGFRSEAFINRFDVEFAKRYLDAVVPRTDGRPVPESWQVLLKRRADADINPIQFAVAGVNAHVDFDLAFALLTTLRALGLPFGDDERYDYNKINDIFAKHMRPLRQHFEDPWVRVLDRGFLAVCADEAGDLTVVIARDRAWDRAKRLSTLTGSKFDEETAEIDREVARVGWALLEVPVL
ncbi:MAG TPA: DUF5995 family protein [Pseudonocardia sp.]|nr:DUF5995 family protein [Pseudonocardia sp.]